MIPLICGQEKPLGLGAKLEAYRKSRLLRRLQALGIGPIVIVGRRVGPMREAA
jgi:hypothetical protein